MNLLQDQSATCPHCWETISLTLDLSVPEQSYVEDCPVCCKPMVVSYTAVVSWVLYKVTDLIIPLRVSADQEELGLDLSQHGEVMQETVAPAPAPEPLLAKTA